MVQTQEAGLRLLTLSRQAAAAAAVVKSEYLNRVPSHHAHSIQYIVSPLPRKPVVAAEVEDHASRFPGFHREVDLLDPSARNVVVRH